MKKINNTSYRYPKSKKFAWFIGIVTTFLSLLCIFKGMGEVVMAIFPSGFGCASGLYASKQYQERKKLEIERISNFNTDLNET